MVQGDLFLERYENYEDVVICYLRPEDLEYSDLVALTRELQRRYDNLCCEMQVLKK